MVKTILVQVATILFLAVFLQFLEYHGVFAVAEGKVADYYLRGAARSADDHRVVTVAITNNDYANWFASTSPLHPLGVSSLITAVQELKPSVIGVDLLTDSWKLPSDSTDPLFKTLQTIRESMVPIVWASGGTGEVHTPEFRRWVLGAHDRLYVTPGKVLGNPVAVPPRQDEPWGVAVFPLDHDRGVRRFPRSWSRLGSDEELTNTFAREVASRHCQVSGRECIELEEADEVFVSYESTARKSPPSADFSVGDLFDCADVSRPCTKWNVKEGISLPPNVVVLLGGTFDQSRDFYPTPLDPQTPGLLIHARAVEAEFRGPKVREASHLVSFILDFLFGGLIVGIFTRPGKLLPRVLARLLAISHQKKLIVRTIACFLLVLPAMLISRALFGLGVLWVSWIGMALTTLSLEVVSELLHDSKHSAPPTTKTPKQTPKPAAEVARV